MKRTDFYVFLAALLLYCITYSVIGIIPVGNGAGWDGSVYLDYIEKLAHGVIIRDDPYRLVRVSGFIPAYFMSLIGFDRHELILFQAVMNAVLLSIMTAVFNDAVCSLTKKSRESGVATASMIISWPFLIMPIYYPVLSDHVALMVSIAALWGWVRSRQYFLYSLIFFSVWIMPGLFAVPFALAAMPYNRSTEKVGSLSCRRAYFVSLLLFITLIAYVLANLMKLSDGEILNHPSGNGAGLADLKYWSYGITVLLLGFGAVVWARIFASRAFWLSIHYKCILVGAGVVCLSYAVMAFAVDLTSGFRGPPLLYYMLLQSSAAPAKPMIAHFVYFGPIFLVALAACVFRSPFVTMKGLSPLAALLSAYLPILILGSESRQWIAVFPIAVAVAASEYRARVLFVCLIFGAALCAPIVVLRDAIMTATSSSGDLLALNWQLYFGRQGPWMSQRSYLLGVLLALIFSCSLFLSSFCRVSHDQKTIR